MTPGSDSNQKKERAILNGLTIEESLGHSGASAWLRLSEAQRAAILQYLKASAKQDGAKDH